MEILIWKGYFGMYKGLWCSSRFFKTCVSTCFSFSCQNETLDSLTVQYPGLTYCRFGPLHGSDSSKKEELKRKRADRLERFGQAPKVDKKEARAAQQFLKTEKLKKLMVKFRNRQTRFTHNLHLFLQQ